MHKFRCFSTANSKPDLLNAQSQPTFPSNNFAETTESPNIFGTTSSSKVPTAEPAQLNPNIEGCQQVPFVDDNDPANILNSLTPLDVDNIAQGIHTYGFWEGMLAIDRWCYDAWIFAADQMGLGLGLGLLVSSLFTKAIFLPFIVYSQMSGIKYKLMAPDMEDLNKSWKRYYQQGNKEAAKLEREKMKTMRRSHGLYPLISFMNILQFPIHLCWMSIINRLSFNYDINPRILTEGFLWFKDLSSPDPYGILPVIAACISVLNIFSSSTSNMNATMKNMRKYMFVLPFISLPIWMTFPSAFSLYWATSSLIHLVVMNLFRSVRFREFLGIPQFLPGTKLERMNSKNIGEVEKPVFYSAPPSKDKIKGLKLSINKTN